VGCCVVLNFVRLMKTSVSCLFSVGLFSVLFSVCVCVCSGAVKVYPIYNPIMYLYNLTLLCYQELPQNAFAECIVILSLCVPLFVQCLVMMKNII